MAPTISLLTASAITALSTPSIATPLSRRQSGVSYNETNTATVTWYQPPLQFGPTACGMSVGSMTMTSGICMDLYTDALGVAQHSNQDCMFTMWPDVTDCTGDRGWTEYMIERGNGTVCVETGVLDGGTWTHASGIYSCFASS